MEWTNKILVVDDNVDAADMTAEVLRMNGHVVEVAYGGREGVEAARAGIPDVIFLDIGMPVMNGFEVARALRLEANLTGVKIVALTAWGDLSSREMSKAAGFDMHLTKPAQIEDLLAVAR